MSRVHMFLLKQQEDRAVVTYVAMSSDFASDSSVQAVAEIRIDKAAREYAFRSVGPWENENVLPPKFFGTRKEEQAAYYSRAYAGFKYGAWTARIHEWVTNLIDRGTYPEKAPLSTSGETTDAT